MKGNKDTEDNTLFVSSSKKRSTRISAAIMPELHDVLKGIAAYRKISVNELINEYLALCASDAIKKGYII